MKRKMMFSLVLALIAILCFQGLAFSRGSGREDPDCEILPQPSSGTYLYGTYTVARDSSSCSIDMPTACGHYDVHVILQKKNKIHLFSFSDMGTTDLCSLGAAGLRSTFALYPCYINVGEPFGKGKPAWIPVIVDMTITKKDFCGTPAEMVKGQITIRVVPNAP
jgi:hypothetical protein